MKFHQFSFKSRNIKVCLNNPKYKFKTKINTSAKYKTRAFNLETN